MVDRDASTDAEPTALYEIRLHGVAPEPLRREFPTATVTTTRTETLLFRQVEKPAELDELIDQLLSRGFVLTEVHQVTSPSTSAAEPPIPSSEKGVSDGEDV